MDPIIIALAALALAGANPVPQSIDPPTVAVQAGPVLPASRFDVTAPRAPLTFASSVAPAPRDTVIQYDRAYYKRLQIHRWGSYAMLPLFAAQVYVGSQLYDGEDDLRDVHRGIAAGVGTLFAMNTTLGIWNLRTMRADPNGRARRYTHATLMLLADAGFVTTGVLGAKAADGDGSRSTHRAVALTSMTLSTVGWLIMTDLFRRD